MQNNNRPKGIYFTTPNSGAATPPPNQPDDLIEDITPSEPTGSGIKGLWIFILILIAVPMTIAATVGAGVFLWRLYEDLPIHSQLQNIEQSLVSKVYDKRGELIHEFSIERRFWVPLSTIPKNLQNAVIAIEDRKFYRHWGIDLQRNIGALIVNYTRGSRAQGASTITQQLARGLYLTPDKSIIRKLREILTALYLEHHFTKDEILELYLNQAYLGAGVYGMQAASERYFSKDVSELSLNESAVLAGTIQTPERLRPDRADNIPRITARRNAVLQSMVITKAIDERTELATRAEPIVANPKVHGPPQAPYFVEMVRRYVSDKYGDDLLYNGGLEIHTTLDLYAQDSAEKSALRRVEALQRRLNRMFLDDNRAERALGITRDAYAANFDSIYAANIGLYQNLHDSLKHRRAQIAVASLDVTTGAVQVLIGGRNFQESRFNRATQARRQAGSAFKPYVYAAAMEHGFSPATVVIDQPIILNTADGEWRPENYDRTFMGPLTIRDALARSNNLVAIQVFNRVGGQVVADYARNMGIRQQLHTGPSLAIGACEVIPIEMTASYGIFANGGVQVEPYFVQKIIDKNGRTLEEATVNGRAVIPPQTAFLMNSMLSSVVCCGTGATIPGLGFRRPAAGKTGTTNDYSDAWFVGYTPQIVTGVWTGIDDRLSMGRGVTGSTAAIPVWVDAMKALHKDLPTRDFARPAGINSYNICTQTGGIATSACPRTRVEVFPKDITPVMCTAHDTRRNLTGGVSDIEIFGGGRNAGNGEDTKQRETRKQMLMF